MSKLNDVLEEEWDACNKSSLRQTELTFGEHTSVRAVDKQIGGSHYKDMAIQPVDFIRKNNLGFCEGNIVKYVCRYQNKGGVQDLQKAKHYLELILEDLT